MGSQGPKGGGGGLESSSSLGEPRRNGAKRGLRVLLLGWGCVWAIKVKLELQRMVLESFWGKKMENKNELAF